MFIVRSAAALGSAVSQARQAEGVGRRGWGGQAHELRDRRHGSRACRCYDLEGLLHSTPRISAHSMQPPCVPRLPLIAPRPAAVVGFVLYKSQRQLFLLTNDR